MKVICAGLMKTGTTSIAKALQILGYKTYDFEEHMFIHLKPWSEVFLEKKEPDFLSMYSDVDAVTDIPPNYFYKEILKAFPDAKVILTERDSEDVWIESWFRHVEKFKRTIGSPFVVTLIALSPTMKNLLRVTDLCDTFILGSGASEKGSSFLLKKKYREHNEQVKASVPSEQLLVYNVKQGWRPLCEFLGCDIPSCPFPRENVKASSISKKAAFKGALSSEKIFREIITRISLIVLLLAVVLVMFVSYKNTRII